MSSVKAEHFKHCKCYYMFILKGKGGAQTHFKVVSSIRAFQMTKITTQITLLQYRHQHQCLFVVSFNQILKLLKRL